MDKKSRILKERAMKKCVALISFPMFLPVMVQAQKEYPIEQVSAINVGDGRILFRDLKTEKPLNGDHRIIDGYHSAIYRLNLRTVFTTASMESMNTTS